jgi:gluconokinase
MVRRARSKEVLILAIDIGTSSVRTALFDQRARLLPRSKADRAYSLHYSMQGAAELDPTLLLRATKHCLRKTGRCLTKGDAPVVAASGFWHSLLGVDAGGDPLTPIYTWADTRAAADAARLREQVNEVAIQRRTGCMVRSSFWLAKLIWLHRIQPRLFRRVARWVSPADWIFGQIFNAHACSHSMASGTGVYDSLLHTWDEELLEVVGLTKSQLPSLGNRREVGGQTIFPAIGDGAAGNLGSDATQPGLIAINVGTSAAIRSVTSDDLPLSGGLFRLVIDEKRNLVGGAISNAGNLREWCLRELKLPGDNRRLEQRLRSTGESAASLTILPFWVGERAPTWPEHLSGVVMGLRRTTTACDIFAAIVAASCHRLAEILYHLENAVGRARRVIVSGGIVQSRASLQILADSLGRNLQVCSEREASLRGAAVYALEQLGIKPPPAPKPRQSIHVNRGRARLFRHQQVRQRALEALLSKSNY